MTIERMLELLRDESQNPDVGLDITLVELRALQAYLSAPIPMFLTCPMCNTRHIDRGEFATKPHHTHSCQGCGLTWRPAKVHTVGVEFLPGFRDPS